MKTQEYWPMDLDPEDAIYENPAWDLPGFSRGETGRPRKPSRRTGKQRRR